MPGFFCIGFIDFMFKGKTLTGFENYLVLQHNFKKNDKVILNHILK